MTPIDLKEILLLKPSEFEISLSVEGFDEKKIAKISMMLKSTYIETEKFSKVQFKKIIN